MARTMFIHAVLISTKGTLSTDFDNVNGLNDMGLQMDT